MLFESIQNWLADWLAILAFMLGMGWFTEPLNVINRSLLCLLRILKLTVSFYAGFFLQAKTQCLLCSDNFFAKKRADFAKVLNCTL